MIGTIEGKVTYSDERSLIVEVASIGYLIAVTDQTAAKIKINETHRFWTYLVVREDALGLYGFTERNELEFFRLLINISGIGPKSALNILSLADVNTLIHAIEGGDGEYLTKVSGIGKKLGQKIVLELKEKIALIPHESSAAHHAETEAIEALEALGYPVRDTRDIVRSVAKEDLSTGEIVRKALQILGGR